MLREFCAVHQRTLRRDEQQGIASEQTRRIEVAAGEAEIVVADTTALMIAVYGDLVFGDWSLYDAASAEQRRCSMTLLTSVDLPWRADGLQRDGAHVRAEVDALVRAALERAGVAFTSLAGVGAASLANALAAIDKARPGSPR